MQDLWRCLLFLGALCGWATAAETDEITADELLEMTLDDLLDVDVVSVSRTRQKLSDTSAAVSVLSGEDLRRSGHSHLAEALRLVPGFHVARLDANKWSVGARGFSGRFTDKLLVLVDGRSVYTPTFAGVEWSTQDTFLPDLDRIEVIRGPGATAWGANAVNGVVNILTKGAKETQGALIRAGGGTLEYVGAGARYGGVLAEEEAWYRVFVSGRVHGDQDDPSGIEGNDAWHQTRAGFRVDWERSESTTITVSGEIYGGQYGQRSIIPTLEDPFATVLANEPSTHGGHFLARWSQRTDEGVEVELQVYLNRDDLRVADMRDERTTVDFDFQYRFAPTGRHDILWGANYRFTTDRFHNGFAISFDPSGRSDHLVGAFVQDTISLIENTLVLTIGTKLEHNDYSGLEVQPSARLRWSPNRRYTSWLSFSRAVRTPSRVDHDVRLNLAAFDNGGTTTLLAFLGNDTFEPEELLSFEWGLRWRGLESVSFELAAFFNTYDNLRGFTALAPTQENVPAPPHTLAASIFDNVMEGDVYGAELSINWQAHERVRLLANYSYSRSTLTNRGITVPLDPETAEGRYPRNIASLRVQIDLAPGWEVDLTTYYSDSAPTLGVPSYVRLDVRVGWTPCENLQLDLIAQNIGHDGDTESVEELRFLQSTEIETSIFLRLTYRW